METIIRRKKVNNEENKMQELNRIFELTMKKKIPKIKIKWQMLLAKIFGITIRA